MKPVVELLGATAELEQAVAYYEERQAGLGERLYLALQAARLFIRAAKKSGARKSRRSQTTVSSAGRFAPSPLSTSGNR